MCVCGKIGSCNECEIEKQLSHKIQMVEWKKKKKTVTLLACLAMWNYGSKNIWIKHWMDDNHDDHDDHDE